MPPAPPDEPRVPRTRRPARPRRAAGWVADAVAVSLPLLAVAQVGGRPDPDGPVHAPAPAAAPDPASAAGGARLLAEAMALVRARFAGEAGRPPGDLHVRAARGLVRELGDPYAELLSPAELEAFTRGLGRYAGVGMEVRPVGDAVYVGTVFPGGGAAAAGLARGARLLRVGGRAVDGAPVDSVVAWLRGAPGTAVAVDVTPPAPGGAPAHRRRLVRGPVRVPAVPYTLVRRGVGYVPLPAVSSDAGAAVEAAVADVVRAGARALVLDLRGNRGGAVDQAVHVANVFLPAGTPVLDIRERRGRLPLVAAGAARPPVTLPLAVLQDERSASAAEIIAGALQDAGRARVVGATSYGKGLAQTVFPLDGGWALKLTTARWYTPNGRSIHRDRTAADSARHDAGEAAGAAGSGGIAPDVRVAADTLPAAAEALARRIAARPAAGRTLAVAAHACAARLRAAAGADTAAPATDAVAAACARDWRAALGRAGVPLDDRAWAGAGPWATRLLGARAAEWAFGPAAAAARELAHDRQYAAADSVLRAARGPRP